MNPFLYLVALLAMSSSYFLQVAAFVPVHIQSNLRVYTSISSAQSPLESSGTTLQQEPSNINAATAAPSPQKIQSLSSRQEFFDLIDDPEHHQDNGLILIKFYSTSCPICQRLQIRDRKLIHYYRTAPNLRFAQLAKPADPELVDALVRQFPTYAVFRRGRCVAMVAVNAVSEMEPKLHATLQAELRMTEEEWDDFMIQYASQMEETDRILQELRSTVEPAPEKSL